MFDDRNGNVDESALKLVCDAILESEDALLVVFNDMVDDDGGTGESSLIELFCDDNGGLVGVLLLVILELRDRPGCCTGSVDCLETGEAAIAFVIVPLGD